MKYSVALLICYCFTCSTYGQLKCSTEDLIGRWKEVKSLSGVQTNVDSLKRLIAMLREEFATLDFKKDGTYTHTFYDNTIKKNHAYSLDISTCEIILGTKRNARKNANLQIIYLDDRFLMFCEDNNPKGMTTHLMFKDRE